MVQLRKFTVLVLILAWNTAGVYATVCSSRCAMADYAQRTAPASLVARPQAKLVPNGAASGSSHPADYCVSELHTMKCLPGLFQMPQPASLYTQALLAAFVPAAPAVQPCTNFHALSPPGLISGRLISQRHTLLRI